MVVLLLLAALASAPAAADDWKGSGYGGGRQWGDAYQSPATTDFGGAPPPASKNDVQDEKPDQDSSDEKGSFGRRHPAVKTGKKSDKSFEEKKEAGPPGDEPRDAPGSGGESGSGRGGGDGGRSSEMSLSDARDNFQGVVESYLAKNGEDGAWTRREGGRSSRLTLKAVETSSVRRAGRGRYSGLVAFKDQRGRKVKLLFTVDFSKNLWEVSSVKRPTEGAAHIVK